MKQIFQLHGMTVEEARQFQQIFKSGVDAMVISDHYDVRVVKKESVDLVHIWKKKDNK